MFLKKLKEKDEVIYELIKKELQREEFSLVLIPSENYVEEEILIAQGSVLTNKYAEGYPKKRYYSGCTYLDEIEQIAIERAKELFGAEHANVQPHSGTNANMAVYYAVLNPGDKIMGLDISHGGHLTHGQAASFSGKLYQTVTYGVSRETELLDYDEIERIAIKEKPKMIVTGASSYSRIIDFERFREIADKIGAYLMVDMAHIAGLVAAGFHPNPCPYADFVTTTTHKTLRGPRGGIILCKKKFAKAIDAAVFPGIQGGPLMHVIAAKAVALKNAMTEEFKRYQEQIIKNTKVLCSEMKRLNYRIVSGGTDTHLFLVDLTEKNVTGKEAQEALEESGIMVNKNLIPFDKRSPFVTSGIRLGAPAVTARGMKGEEMKIIATFIEEVLSDINNKEIRKEIKEKVRELCSRFPIYSNFLES
ncbi:MAG: serine hydroxymethyltransferase [Desulfobacterota bacterium]|nr:serine hydroxymethyltransferase [Thermodesulfobacteriota bacterium]MDW8002493.1 serine hydroxymethyltransferase [Deltaproteobacteria bacterium]